jgi:nucleotide-binding universal stress UspA family protein
LSTAALRVAVHIPEDLFAHVRVLNATGHAAAAILDTARSISAQAILLSSHGVTGDLSRTAGHVTLDVLADAPCPVYVVRSALDAKSQAHRLRHLRRVLVPLDRSSDATAAVQYASALALATGAQLHLLHVLGDDPAVRRAPVAPPYTDQPQHELAAWTEEFIRESFAAEPRPEKVDCQCALRVGVPGDQIAAYAEEEDCDLIVAAWAGSLVPGRAAVVRTLLERARCPLLFVLASEGERAGSSEERGQVPLGT